jgi:hypothetical protein
VLLKFFNCFLILIAFHHVQRERAESARLALELQQARQINVQLADLQQQQIGQARQQSNALLQVLSRGYLDDIIASLSLSHTHSLPPPPARALSLCFPSRLKKKCSRGAERGSMCVLCVCV